MKCSSNPTNDDDHDNDEEESQRYNSQSEETVEELKLEKNLI